ncbi:hypothetical protein Syun_009002 [Stephania yunnanensis]|uniref:Uncharacterized protein n=1 Tax=Stephania yunnanensis TaxID=152371 RepID=A0AAP0KFD3_9MAGN
MKAPPEELEKRLKEAIKVVSQIQRLEGLVQWSFLVGTTFTSMTTEASMVDRKVSLKVYKGPDHPHEAQQPIDPWRNQKERSPSPVARTCDSARASKWLNIGLISVGGVRLRLLPGTPCPSRELSRVVWAKVWIKRFLKLRAPRVGWLNRAANTSRFLQWKDYEPVPPGPEMPPEPILIGQPFFF